MKLNVKLKQLHRWATKKTILMGLVCVFAVISYFHNAANTALPVLDEKWQQDVIIYPRKVKINHIKLNKLGAYYDHLIYVESIKHKVNPFLIRAVMKVESNFDHLALSPAGAMGLMQLMPDTAKELGVQNPYDPEESVEGGVKYLRKMLDLFEGNEALAVAAYNAGPGAILQKNGLNYPETKKHIRKVAYYYTEYSN